MKSVTFVVKVKTYLQAAEVEEFLTKLKLPYEERINDGAEVRGAGTRKYYQRHKVTPELVASVKNYVKMHPNWSPTKIKEHYDLVISPESVRRIMIGKFDGKGVKRTCRELGT